MDFSVSPPTIPSLSLISVALPKRITPATTTQKATRPARSGGGTARSGSATPCRRPRRPRKTIRTTRVKRDSVDRHCFDDLYQSHLFEVCRVKKGQACLEKRKQQNSETRFGRPFGSQARQIPPRSIKQKIWIFYLTLNKRHFFQTMWEIIAFGSF